MESPTRMASTPAAYTSKDMTWKEACKTLGIQPISVEGAWQQGLSSRGTSGVQFADVEVDIETGITRVKKIVCVQDCGMIVDKLTAESQVYGGIIMGIGFAMFKHRILDRNTAKMVNPNMEFYLLPGMSDIPEIDITLVDQPERAGGGDTGPMPIELLGVSLGTCVALYVQQFCQSRDIATEGLRVEVSHTGASNPGRIGAFAVEIVLPGALRRLVPSLTPPEHRTPASDTAGGRTAGPPRTEHHSSAVAVEGCARPGQEPQGLTPDRPRY